MSVASAIAARVIVDVPATCGELIQGVDRAGGPLLVSLPVALTGRTIVTLLHEGVVTVHPYRERAAQALGAALDRAGWRGGARVELETGVPLGHGWGSSTIDIAGVVLGVAHACGDHPGSGELLRRMTDVEPSDGSPLGGLWLVDHVRGSTAGHLGPAPRTWVVVVDEGPAVETGALHQISGPGVPIPPGEIDVLRAAVATGALDEIGRVATRSALRNQERLPNRTISELLDLCRHLGLCGVVAAHSGSLAGVLVPDVTAAREAAARLRAGGHPASLLAVAAPGAVVRITRRTVH